jgi:hypothetical protein
VLERRIRIQTGLAINAKHAMKTFAMETVRKVINQGEITYASYFDSDVQEENAP